MDHSHMQQLLLAFANVDELLKVLPAKTLHEHVGAIKDLHSKLGKYTRKKAPSKRGPETIVRSLEKKSKSLRRYLSHPKDALETIDRTVRDIRVQDVLSWEKQTKWPFVTALRRGLAGRSLALQHYRWEKRMFGASRLDDFTACFDSGSAVDNADGTIPEFLNAHGLDRVDGVTHAIRTGVKLLVLEMHCTSEKSVCGLLLFCPGDLYRTKISDLRRLRNMLEDHQCLHALANEHEGWFDQFVAIYEGQIRLNEVDACITFNPPPQQPQALDSSQGNHNNTLLAHDARNTEAPTISAPHQPQAKAAFFQQRHDNAHPADSLAMSQILNWRAADRQEDQEVSTADQIVANFATQSQPLFERDLMNGSGPTFMREDWLPVNLGADDLMSPFDINLDLQQLSHQA